MLGAIKRKILFIFCLMCINLVLIFSDESVSKKYYNNIFAGGKEKLYSLKGNVDSVEIEDLEIYINLFEDYSQIELKYSIKNDGKDLRLYFAYPRLDARIEKGREINGLKDSRLVSQFIKGDYFGYSIKVGDKIAKYKIEKGKKNEVELSYPYKIGNTKCFIKNREKIEETIESYNYRYSWYVTKFKLKKNERKIITVSYKTPHYYNSVVANNSKKLSVIEDPALRYFSFKRGRRQICISEKIFSYLLHTVYSKEQKIAKRVTVYLKSNVIDPDYLKIFPRNYKKRKGVYIWKYRKLKAKSVNNILVKISPDYSDNTLNPQLFSITPKIKVANLSSFYEINKSKDFFSLRYIGDAEKISVKKIRIKPECSDDNFQNVNLPLEMKIEFSNKSDFSDSVKFVKKMPLKKMLKSLKKKCYFTIYRGREIKCKYIRLTILKTSNKSDIVKISDIQVLH